MKLRRVDEPSATVLDVVGRLDGSTSEMMHWTLLELIAEAPPRLVIDLGGMEYISSAGLRILLIAAKQVRGTTTKLILCGMRPNVLEVFEISGLVAVFNIVPGRDAAIAHDQ